MEKLVLYIGGSCPYCRRVLDFLNQHPMTIEIKDVWVDEKANQEMIKLTGKTQVPCLRIGGGFMHESLDIIEKLKELQHD